VREATLLLVNVTSERGKVRPLLRAVALFAGLTALAGGTLVLVLGIRDFYTIVMGVYGLIMGAFFVYVGLTGQNYDAPKC
jgi:hypothetical protein